jgi:hypothetical protein
MRERKTIAIETTAHIFLLAAREGDRFISFVGFLGPRAVKPDIFIESKDN